MNRLKVLVKSFQQHYEKVRWRVVGVWGELKIGGGFVS